MDRKFTKLFAGAAAVAVALSSIGTVVAQEDEGSSDGPPYLLGMSNTLVGNGWRDEMRCSIRAQAALSGEVDNIIELHRITTASGQLEDIRNLISTGVDAIIINPSGPDALNEAIKQATDQGIPVISVDQDVTEPSAYVMANDQDNYAYLGAKWLFEQLGGAGDVVYMRGFAGHPADNDRDRGFKRAQEEYPGINIVKETFTGWDHPTARQQMIDWINTGIPFDGVWTSGTSQVVTEAMIQSVDEGTLDSLVPVVGADNAGFVQLLIDVDGLVGAAVTNPAAVGGAGVTVALEILDGERPVVPDEAARRIIIEPVVLDNQTEEGRAGLEAIADPRLDPFWPAVMEVPGYTTHTKEQVIACLPPLPQS